MNINDKYIVKIIDEDNIGNGIAKINKIVVFVKNALLNEELEIEIISIKKNYANGKILKYIKKSDKRIPIKCKYYDLCGGCNFMHTTYNNERNIKLKYLEKLFNNKIEYLKTNQELNYRNKVTLHVLNGKIGYYNDKTHVLCEIDSCMLLNPKINQKIDEIKKLDLSNINEIIIRCINNNIMINFIGNIDNINIECDSLYINSIYKKGKEYLIYEINNYKFSIYPDSFYQVNCEGMKSIYNKVFELLKEDDSLLDLYCGTGTIGIWMNKKFKRILGVEINKDAILNAKINKKLNNINNIDFICNDAKNIKLKYDTIIVDPPRNGLSKDVVNYLNKSNAKTIAYISCNPNTLKRDIDLLYNYNIIHLSCCDMFPRTKHCESVCLLERRR